MQDGKRDDVRAAVLALLGERGGQARFVPELIAALDARTAISGSTARTEDAQIDRALRELESAGAIVVRDHFCGDPHLEGVDLRIAALARAGITGADPQVAAVEKIETRWQRWLAEYLATHRCT